MENQTQEIKLGEVKSKMTPSDFFLYLGILITLYASSIALVTFLFTVIDVSFLDNQDYSFERTGPLASSLSIFIVFFPILLVLISTARKSILKNSFKAKLALRRWFIYLTLFITGLSIAVDLIILINFFLSGQQLTSSFIFKVISVIIVAGAIFLFSFNDLRGKFIDNTKLFKSFIIGTSIIVFCLIVIGLFLIGSPSKLRNQNFDKKRVDDLSFIQSEIISYWQLKERLPENLSDLNDPLRNFEVPFDPETKESYDYKVISQEEFEICANFKTEQKIDETKPNFATPYGFDHGSGNVCFYRKIDREKFPFIKEQRN
jgi:hypothetical protein